jgi:proline iminopeptidase
LTRTYHFYYYDQRGSGNSTRPFDRFASSNYVENMTGLERTLGIGAQLADIERIRRILGQDKLILVGHSWGGLLAALYAAEFPDHVQALILVSPADALVMPQEGGGLFEQVRRRLPADQRAAYDDWYRGYMDFGGLFAKSENDLAQLNTEFGEFYRQVSDSPMRGQGKPGGWMVWAMYLSMGTRHDWRDALKAIRAPTLVIHGRKDLQPEQASRVYAASIPNAQFQIIENAAHFSFEQNPTTFASVVENFLNGSGD